MFETTQFLKSPTGATLAYHVAEAVASRAASC